ncbi:hypothetical protein PF023_12905, partial [Enterococcus thailandicus]
VGGPSGLRKTNKAVNSLAHRTTWLRSTSLKAVGGGGFHEADQMCPDAFRGVREGQTVPSRRAKRS